MKIIQALQQTEKLRPSTIPGAAGIWKTAHEMADVPTTSGKISKDLWQDIAVLDFGVIMNVS
ncbi:MAG: hypothetical protein J5967_09605, partial [Oscillospiraceae bacterium]|nr:hypothetical protein [Oscillospiraceae bacterium]